MEKAIEQESQELTNYISPPPPKPSITIYVVIKWFLVTIIVVLIGWGIYKYITGNKDDKHRIRTLLEKIWGYIYSMLKWIYDKIHELYLKFIVDEEKEKIEKKVDGAHAKSSMHSSDAPTTSPSPQDNKVSGALKGGHQSTSSPQPDSGSSGIQHKGKSGPGWCLVGTDSKHNNVCAEIKQNDTCMSGKVFSTNDICINPNLRAGTE